MSTETWLDLSIVVGFIIVSVLIGLAHRHKASQNLEEYFLAGRSVPGWKAGLSMAATQYAADTPLLVTGLVATAGIFSVWRLWIYAIAFLLMAFVLSSPWRRARILTDAELMELRYSGRLAGLLRALKAVHMGTLINCTVLAMVLIAAARIAEPFLIWHEWLPRAFMQPIAQALEHAGFLLTTLPENHPEAWVYSANNFFSIAAIVLFTWTYSTTGGLRSVISTDLLQFSIMMLATGLYAFFAIAHVGGLKALTTKLHLLYESQADTILSFGPSRWDDAAFLFAGVLAVQWFAQASSDGTGYLAQRSMACRTDHDARIAGTTFTFAQVLFRGLLWLPIAVGLLILYPVEHLPTLGSASEGFRIAREATFAHGIRDLLPAGVRGLMLTAMLAAIASTVDTHLNWGSSYWTHDLYDRFLMKKWLRRKPQPRELVWVARLSSVGILFIALFIAIHLSSIQSAWHLSLLFGSGLGATLILRWLWHRINIYSELAAVLVSLGLSPVLIFGFPELSEGARLLWMVFVSTISVISITLLTRPEPNTTLMRFYKRARPMGWWKPVAHKLGEDTVAGKKALLRSLSAVKFSCITLFSLKIGTGILLLQSPTGVLLFWPWLLIVTGIAVIPLWLRLGFKHYR